MFGKKTVASVMSVFTKTVEYLNEIRRVNLVDADNTSELISAMEARKLGYEAEAALAETNARAIQKMLNG